MRIYLLGELRVYAGEERIALPTKPIKALFAYLVTHRERGYPPEMLAGTFWGEASEERARASLNNALSALRRALSGSIVVEYGNLRFNSKIECWLDVAEFEERLRESRGLKRPEERLGPLRRAVELYRGDFLEGFYDDWAIVEQERLRELYLQALRELVGCHRALKEYSRAIECCRKILALSPLREEIHRELMYLHYTLGDRNAALLQYQECYKVLKEELKVKPLPETKALYEEIREQAELAGLELISDRLARAKLLLARYPELRAPFIGRAEELARLVATWERAKAGQGSLLLIAGEAGAGKTRLVREFLGLISREEPSVLIGNCYRPGTGPGLPYQPLREALRDYLPRVDPARLKRVRSSWLEEVAKLVPELSDLARVPVPERLPVPLQPEEQWRLTIALTQSLIALAEATQPEPRPLLLVLDDLHQADESTIQYLDYLAHHLPRERILLLGTYRTEEVPRPLEELIAQLQPRGLLEQVSLGRLSQEEAASLIRQMLNLSGEEEFIEKVYLETGGNPLFIIELMKSLIEGGALSIEEGQWRIPSAGAIEAHIPPTIRELVSVRLRRLSHQRRELLGLAAVSGQELDLEVLARVDGLKESELAEAIEELTDAHFLEEREGSYRFSHELVRQAVYDSLGPLKRRRLHLQLGEALELAAPHRVEELGHHFYQGQRWERAFAYLMEAAGRAERTYALGEALSYLDMAGEALHRLRPQGRGERVQLLAREFELLQRRARICGTLGRRKEQEAGIRRLFSLAEELGDEAKLAEAQHQHVELLLSQGEFQEARIEAEKELAIRIKLGDKRGEALCLRCLTAVCTHIADYPSALEHCKRSMEVFRELGDSRGEAAALGDSGLIYWYLGQYEQAGAALERAHTLSGEAGDRQAQGRLLNNLGAFRWRLGDYTRALEAFTSASQLAQEAGDRRGELNALGNIAALWASLGRYEEAKDLQEQALSGRREIRDRRGEALSLYNLGIVERSLGRPTRAIRYLNDSLEICCATDDRRREAVARNELGFTYLSIGRTEEALEQLRQAKAINSRLNDSVVEVENLAYCSLAHLFRGEAETALECSARAVALLEAGVIPEAPQLVYFAHSKALAARGVKAAAASYLEKAAAEVHKRADNLKDSRLRESFLNSGVNREIVLATEGGSAN
ncbi:MAG: tetratricopeptide repeat protein [Candidatus Acetothermia bacterium]|nr:tetratricopeptide repeat protein [Candidatus Acetothermia bacterium]